MHGKSEKEPLLLDGEGGGGAENAGVEISAGGEGFPSCRLVLILLGSLGFVNVCCLRVNLSVAMVAMVNHTQQVPALNYYKARSDDICESNESIAATQLGTEGVEGGEFNWDSYTQAAILAAFFYGYMTTQV